MKNIALLISILSLLSNGSCDTTDEASPAEHIRFFELQYIETGLSGKITEKQDLEFNEFIELRANNQFIKRRKYPDSTSLARGSFQLVISKDSDYYEPEFEEDSYLIQNCTGSTVERISILNEREIFNGGYLPCDGPGYGYRLID